MFIFRAWDRFFFSRFDPHALAFVRIAVGVLWLLMLIFLSPNWQRFFGPDGLPGIHDPALIYLPRWWSVFAWTDGIINVWVFLAFGILSALLMIVGVATRFATACCWLLQVSMMHRSIMIINGEDPVFSMVLWWGLFLPWGRSLSVDAWWRARRFARHGRIDPRPPPLIWSTRMLQISVALIYACSLPRKLLGDPAWLGGDAFFFAIINGHWSKWPFKEIFYHHWTSAVMTYTTIAAEGSFPILVWFRRTRLPAILIMSIFHVMIALMLDNVAFFSLSMVTTFSVFIPGPTTRRWIASLTAWIKKKQAEAEAMEAKDRRKSPAPTDDK